MLLQEAVVFEDECQGPEQGRRGDPLVAPSTLVLVVVVGPGPRSASIDIVRGVAARRNADRVVRVPLGCTVQLMAAGRYSGPR